MFSLQNGNHLSKEHNLTNFVIVHVYVVAYYFPNSRISDDRLNFHSIIIKDKQKIEDSGFDNKRESKVLEKKS